MESTYTADSSSPTTVINGVRVKGSATQLPFGGQGTPGGQVPPNQWGMCGIAKLSLSNVDSSTIANIVIDSQGFYQVNVGVNPDNPASTVSMTVRCVNMSEFVGAPHFSFSTPIGTYENTITQNNLPFDLDIVLQALNTGSSGSATKYTTCLWHGFSGNLSGTVERPIFAGMIRSNGTGYYHEMKLHRARNTPISSVAVCDGWTPTHEWQYEIGENISSLNEHGSAPENAYFVNTSYVDLRVRETDGICFIQGMHRKSNDYLTAEVKVVNGRWYAYLSGITVPTGSRISVHCLSKNQTY